MRWYHWLIIALIIVIGAPVRAALYRWFYRTLRKG